MTSRHKLTCNKGVYLRIGCVPFCSRSHGSHRLLDEPSSIRCHPGSLFCRRLLHRHHLWRHFTRLLRHDRGFWLSPWRLLSEHVVPQSQARRLDRIWHGSCYLHWVYGCRRLFAILQSLHPHLRPNWIHCLLRRHCSCTWNRLLGRCWVERILALPLGYVQTLYIEDIIH